jgi:hypothetical protein
MSRDDLPGYDAWKLASGPPGADHSDACRCEWCEDARIADEDEARATAIRCGECGETRFDVRDAVRDCDRAMVCGCLGSEDPACPDYTAWIATVLPPPSFASLALDPSAYVHAYARPCLARGWAPETTRHVDVTCPVCLATRTRSPS